MYDGAATTSVVGDGAALARLLLRGLVALVRWAILGGALGVATAGDVPGTPPPPPPMAAA